MHGLHTGCPEEPAPPSAPNMDASSSNNQVPFTGDGTLVSAEYCQVSSSRGQPGDTP